MFAFGRKAAGRGFIFLFGVALVYQLAEDGKLFFMRVNRPAKIESLAGRGVNDNGRRHSESEDRSRQFPRILTVLTTYTNRSSFVKPYKDAVLRNRLDGSQPTVFVVSDEGDEDPDGVIDFLVGTSRRHRLLPAIREACRRYEGRFDWLAVGDDDTVFMYNRAAAFLKHINHTQPLVFGKVDGLNPTASPCSNRACFSPEQKLNRSDQAASQGCCLDFIHPCKVPIYPERPEPNRTYHYQDYGPGGLFWPYGGSGAFISVGMAMDVVGGADGWGTCAQTFGIMNTDVQLAQCLKTHGHSIGSYPEGFFELQTTDPGKIQDVLAADCQIMGVHLEMKHFASNGLDAYTTESFQVAVSTIRDMDMASSGNPNGIQEACPEAWAAISRWHS